jgi:hypothetical protein
MFAKKYSPTSSVGTIPALGMEKLRNGIGDGGARRRATTAIPQITKKATNIAIGQWLGLVSLSI